MANEIEKNMLRERSDRLPDVTPELWDKVLDEHKMLFDEYFEVNQQLSKQTRIQYESGIKQFFIWVHDFLKNKPMYEITKRDFMRYMSYLTKHGLSSSALRFKKSSVSTLCNYIENVIADDDEKYKSFRNFTKGLPAIPANAVYDKVKISKEEYDLLMDTLLKEKDYMGAAWVAAAFNTGARRTELLQFKTEILDYEVAEGRNYVMSHIVRGKGKSVDGKPLRYMVNLDALKYMKLWVDNRGYDHEYIFTVKYGGKIKRISGSWANEFCRNTLSKILGRRINPHLFKASCITYLLEEKGVDIALVSKFVAQHNDISTTSNFYDLRDFEDEKDQIF